MYSKLHGAKFLGNVYKFSQKYSQVIQKCPNIFTQRLFKNFKEMYSKFTEVFTKFLRNVYKYFLKNIHKIIQKCPNNFTQRFFKNFTEMYLKIFRSVYKVSQKCLQIFS